MRGIALGRSITDALGLRSIPKSEGARRIIGRRTDQFVGDGRSSSFSASLIPCAHPGYIVNDGVYETLGGDWDDGACWSFASHGVFLRRFGPPTEGAIILFSYDYETLGVDK